MRWKRTKIVQQALQQIGVVDNLQEARMARRTCSAGMNYYNGLSQIEARLVIDVKDEADEANNYTSVQTGINNLRDGIVKCLQQVLVPMAYF